MVCARWLCVVLIAGLALATYSGCKKEGDTVIVAPANWRPEVDIIPDQVATRGLPFVLDLSPYVTDDRDDVTSLKFVVLLGQGIFSGTIYQNTFDSEGPQVVDFVVLDTEGAGATGLLNINVLSPPFADFTADSTYGPATFTVNFTDVTTGDIDTWSWDFGDSDTSTEQDPSHDYTSPGWYDVSLSVSGPGGSDAVTKQYYIQVLEPASNIWYVDSSNTGTTIHDGFTWDTAFLTILSGIEAATDGDVVLVADGTYTGTSNTELDFGGKLLYLKAYDYYGTGLCTIDCENGSRAFYFHNGETSEAVVEGFTIIGGYSPTTGAGIYMNGASPVIRNCSITNCLSDTYGGAIGFDSSSPVITGCVLSYNLAAVGGAIYSGTTNATTIISHCTLDDNRGIGGGGGIFCLETLYLAIDHCTFTDNSGPVGGCIYAVTGDTINITDCTISRNNAISIAGGMYIAGYSTLNISDSNIENNTGGTIFAVSLNATVLDCEFTDNESLSLGAAITSIGNSTTPHDCALIVAGCTFTGNSSLYSTLVSDYMDTTVDNCVFLDNDGNAGGAFMFSGSDTDPAFFVTVVTNCTMTGNIAYGGGAVYGTYSNATFENCTIANNFALAETGGGIFIDGDGGRTALTLKDCNLLNNTSFLGGGALSVQNMCDPLIITGCKFAGNHTKSIAGAIHINNDDATLVPDILLSNCEIINNSAMIYAGGIYLNGYFDAAVTGCTIEGNSASQQGGGIYVSGSDSAYISSFSIDNCAIEGNDGGLYGGGLYAEVEYLNFGPAVNCIVKDNEVSMYGAGILLNGGFSGSTTTTAFTNCLITGNHGSEFGGGVLISSIVTATFNNCTIADNEALSSGGGFYCDSANSVTTLNNCIIWSNTAGTTGSQIFYGTSEFVLLSSDYSNATADIMGSGTFAPDAGCITLDPLFVMGPLGNYYISQISAGQTADSPCLDAGAGTLAGLGLAGRTTRTDEVADTGPPDIGYHYDP